MTGNEEIISLPGPFEEPFSLSMTGISYCDGSYRIKRGKCPLFVFEYVIKGKGSLNIGSKHFKPEEGDVYIIHNYMPHEYVSSSENPWTKIWFNVQGELVGNLLSVYNMNKTYIVKNAGKKVLEIFRKGYGDIKDGCENPQIKASVIIHEIIAELSLILASRAKPEASKNGLKLKKFLDENYRKNPTLEEMSAYINKSPVQTIRIFTRDWNITPYKYLLDKKIEAAQMFLVNTAARVKEIAFLLGFSDEYYFSNIFKKKTGISPSLYRNKFR